MDFAFSAEQDEFREMLARFIAERWPLSEERRLVDTPLGYDAAVWKQLAGELGLLGLIVPEAHGGQGSSFLELGIALEELGRELAGGPYFATACLAVQALLNVADEAACAQWLPQIASGDLVATLAAGVRTGVPDPDAIECLAEPVGDAFTLRGQASWVPNGQDADLILVAARRPGSHGADGVSLLAVRGDAPGLERASLEPLDPTRRLAHLAFGGAPAELLGEAERAWPALARTLDQAAIGLTAEMVGGTDRCRAQAVEYAKSRIQFARPIGSFQAIKHKAAEVLLELESARSVAYWSWWVASRSESTDAEVASAASIAKSVCADAYLRASRESIQIHGGMGFTWEADPHLYYRRAQSSAILFGDASAHRARLAAGLLS